MVFDWIRRKIFKFRTRREANELAKELKKQAKRQRMMEVETFLEERDYLAEWNLEHPDEIRLLRTNEDELADIPAVELKATTTASEHEASEDTTFACGLEISELTTSTFGLDVSEVTTSTSSLELSSATTSRSGLESSEDTTSRYGIKVSGSTTSTSGLERSKATTPRSGLTDSEATTSTSALELSEASTSRSGLKVSEATTTASDNLPLTLKDPESLCDKNAETNYVSEVEFSQQDTIDFLKGPGFIRSRRGPLWSRSANDILMYHMHRCLTPMRKPRTFADLSQATLSGMILEDDSPGLELKTDEDRIGSYGDPPIFTPTNEQRCFSSRY